MGLSNSVIFSSASQFGGEAMGNPSKNLDQHGDQHGSLMLRRFARGIAQHFAMSCGATAGHRGFDGTRVIVLGAMVPWSQRGNFSLDPLESEDHIAKRLN